MTGGPSGEYVEKYWELARQFLGDAQLALEHGRLRTALDRAYYGMFHAAQALVLLCGLPLPKTHRGLISLFGRVITEKGLMPPQAGRVFSRTFRRRQVGTYEVHASFSTEEVAALLQGAREFVDRVQEAAKVLGQER